MRTLIVISLLSLILSIFNGIHMNRLESTFNSLSMYTMTLSRQIKEVERVLVCLGPLESNAYDFIAYLENQEQFYSFHHSNQVYEFISFLERR